MAGNGKLAGLGNLERFLSNKWSLGFSVRWRGQGVGLAEVEEGEMECGRVSGFKWGRREMMWRSNDGC